MASTPGRSGMQLPMRIWDSPTRLFHWLLVVLVITCYVSIKLNNMTVHMLAGESIFSLLIFRIFWGFFGSDTARFSQFLKSPVAAIKHLLHFGRREPDTQIGHNEAGGWMVIGMIAILLLQVVSGLIANDADSFVAGPLAARVSEDLGATALRLHGLNFDLIKIVVVLHIVAIIAYGAIKRHDLVRPMITGKKRLPAATPAPYMAPTVIAAAAFVASGAVVVALIVWGGK